MTAWSSTTRELKELRVGEIFIGRLDIITCKCVYRVISETVGDDRNGYHRYVECVVRCGATKHSHDWMSADSPRLGAFADVYVQDPLVKALEENFGNQETK